MTGETENIEGAWLNLTARDMMQTGMVTVPMDATATEIERTLVENKISGVPVHDNADKIVGIISWRDVMEYFAENHSDDPRNPHAFYRFVDVETQELGYEIEIPLDETVVARDVMSTDLLTAPATSNLQEVAKLMTERGVHRVLITDPFGDIIGILSTLDILRSLAR